MTLKQKSQTLPIYHYAPNKDKEIVTFFEVAYLQIFRGCLFRISSWIFELGFFGGFFFGATSSRGLFKMEEREDYRFNLSEYCIRNCIFDWK